MKTFASLKVRWSAEGERTVELEGVDISSLLMADGLTIHAVAEPGQPAEMRAVLTLAVDVDLDVIADVQGTTVKEQQP